MAQYIEEYNKIIKNTYSNNCEDLGISIYEYDDYVPIIYIDNTSSLLPTLPHICDNQKYNKTNTKNILILGFEFLMKKIKKKSAKISELRDDYGELRDEMRDDIAELRSQNAGLRGELAGLRGELAGLRGELAELRVQNAELRGELAELRDNLGEIISRMRS